MKIDKFHPGLRILAESNLLVVGHEYEAVYLIFKGRPLKEIELGEHYGDPKCAVIAPNNNWAVVGGQGVTLWRKVRKGIFGREQNEVSTIQISELTFIHSLKIEDDYKVRVLVNPWGQVRGTWILNMKDLSLQKISEGPDLREEPYRDEVEF